MALWLFDFVDLLIRVYYLSTPTTRVGSTPRLPPVPIPLVVLTSNPPTSPGGCEMTRRTAHHVLQPQTYTISLPCHNRGCYLMIQLTSHSLPALLGKTNYHLLCHNRGWKSKCHNRGCKSKNSRTTLTSVSLLLQRLQCLVHDQLPYSHHPLGHPTILPLRAAQHSLLQVATRSDAPTLKTVPPTSLPASTNSKMNSLVLGPTTRPRTDAKRTRPLTISYPHPLLLLPSLTPTPTPTPTLTPTLTPTPTPTPTPTHTSTTESSPFTGHTSHSRPTLEPRTSL